MAAGTHEQDDANPTTRQTTKIPLLCNALRRVRRPRSHSYAMLCVEPDNIKQQSCNRDPMLYKEPDNIKQQSRNHNPMLYEEPDNNKQQSCNLDSMLCVEPHDAPYWSDSPLCCHASIHFITRCATLAHELLSIHAVTYSHYERISTRGVLYARCDPTKAVVSHRNLTTRSHHFDEPKSGSSRCHWSRWSRLSRCEPR